MSDARDQPDAGYFEGREHRYPLRIFYEDTDFSGVVYYANYLRFFERGRSSFFRQAGIGHAELLKADPALAFVVRKFALDYQIPASIDDALIVSTRFHSLKGARVSVSQKIMRGDQTLVTGQGEVAVIDLTGRPRRVPQAMADKLAPYLSKTP